MSPSSSTRLRVGLAIWLVSWVPFPVILLAIGHRFGWGQDDASASRFLAIAWTVQIVLGLVGVAIAGSAAIGVVKAVGWRRLPRVAWAAIRHGEVDITPEAPVAG